MFTADFFMRSMRSMTKLNYKHVFIVYFSRDKQYSFLKPLLYLNEQQYDTTRTPNSKFGRWN